MEKKITRRQAITLGVTGGAALLLAACTNPSGQAGNEATTTPSSIKLPPTKEPLPGLESQEGLENVPYLPRYERLSDEDLPSDVISVDNLWRSYHARIWANDNCRFYLRPGIAEQLLFQDLHNRKIDKLDIALLDENNDLTEEQRKNLDPELVQRFDEHNEKRNRRYSGVIMGAGNSIGIFVRRYDPEESEHMFEDMPVPEDEMISTWSTPQMTLRHEVAHYNQWGFSSNLEEIVGMDNYRDLLKASEKQKGDDSSGYWVVMEMREGVVIAKEDFMTDLNLG